jgi:hypothetical protein
VSYEKIYKLKTYNFEIKSGMCKRCIFFHLNSKFLLNKCPWNTKISKWKKKTSVLPNEIIIDYHMAFFISHVISTRDAHISPRAKGPRANMGWELIWHVIYTCVIYTCVLDSCYERVSETEWLLFIYHRVTFGLALFWTFI